MENFVYGMKVRDKETHERGKVVRVSADGRISVEFMNGEWAIYDADELEAVPADPPPSATEDVGALWQQEAAQVEYMLDEQRRLRVGVSKMYQKLLQELGDALGMEGEFTVNYGVNAMLQRVSQQNAALAQAEAQRDAAVAALKRIEEMAIAAMGEWMSSVELIPASLPELQVYWDIAKAAADALAQQEGSDGE